MKRALIALAVVVVWPLTTAGSCATTGEPRIETKVVEVPVSAPCNANAGPRPDYPDTDAALREAPGIFAKVQLLLAGRELRRPREDKLEAALTACGGKTE